MNSIAIQTFDKLESPVYGELATFDEVGALSLSKVSAYEMDLSGHLKLTSQAYSI